MTEKKSELDKYLEEFWAQLNGMPYDVPDLMKEWSKWLSSRILEKAREREYNPSALEWSYDDNLRAIDIDDLKAIIEELTK